jgi:predicted kinase
MPCRRVLVLTGPPAVGKTTTARAVAATRERCAVIDVDDVRQLVVSGGAAPWDGDEGLRQQRLGVRNACALAGNVVGAGIDVVIADVLTPETSALYRELLPGCLVVHLTVPLEEARRRAATRTVWLTDEEFVALHVADASADHAAGLAPDHVRDVRDLDPDQQAAAVEAVWRSP